MGIKEIIVHFIINWFKATKQRKRKEPGFFKDQRLRNLSYVYLYFGFEATITFPGRMYYGEYEL